MPSPVAAIGGTFTAYVPDDDQQIALGFTGVRFYYGATEAGSWTLVDTETLVSGQKDYSYNYTSALATGWFWWALYGAVPGEGPGSEPVPIGPTQSTRLAIRQGVGKRERLVDVVSVASAADATSFVASELIDPDGSAYRIANRMARPTTGTYAGNTRRVRSGATGYAVASGTVTVGRSFGGTLSAGNEVELWKPRGDDDVSVLIDDAMQRARTNLWWEDVHYFTADSNITEYWLPALVRKDRIKAVEYAADTYPTRPGWTDVLWWDVVMDGGIPLMSIVPELSEGTVIRVTYNAHGDRMDSDTDYWCVPLEWAIAEVAMEFLKTQRVPAGNKEDVSDAAVAIGDIQQEVMTYRRTYMPDARVTVRIAR